MDNLFYEKYLKYKAKYLALGGGDPTSLQGIADKLDTLIAKNSNHNPNPTGNPDEQKIVPSSVKSSPVKSSPLALTCKCEL